MYVLELLRKTAYMYICKYINSKLCIEMHKNNIYNKTKQNKKHLKGYSNSVYMWGGNLHWVSSDFFLTFISVF